MYSVVDANGRGMASTPSIDKRCTDIVVGVVMLTGPARLPITREKTTESSTPETAIPEALTCRT